MKVFLEKLLLHQPAKGRAERLDPGRSIRTREKRNILIAARILAPVLGKQHEDAERPEDNEKRDAALHGG